MGIVPAPDLLTLFMTLRKTVRRGKREQCGRTCFKRQQDAGCLSLFRYYLTSRTRTDPFNHTLNKQETPCS